MTLRMMNGQTPPVLIDTTSSTFETEIYVYTLINGAQSLVAVGSINLFSSFFTPVIESQVVISFKANVECFIVVVR